MRAGLATLRGLGVRSLRVFDDGSLVDAMRRLQVSLGAGERAREGVRGGGARGRGSEHASPASAHPAFLLSSPLLPPFPFFSLLLRTAVALRCEGAGPQAQRGGGGGCCRKFGRRRGGRGRRLLVLVLFLLLLLLLLLLLRRRAAHVCAGAGAAGAPGAPGAGAGPLGARRGLPPPAPHARGVAGEYFDAPDAAGGRAEHERERAQWAARGRPPTYQRLTRTLSDRLAAPPAPRRRPSCTRSR